MPQDRMIMVPNELATFLPEEYELYVKLLNMESKLDSAITTKRRSLDASLRSPSQTARRSLVLRIYCSHSRSPHTATDKSDTGDPTFTNGSGSWMLRIEGKLSDDHTHRSKFSTFFRKVVLELDKTIHRDCTVEWARYRAPTATDGFKITRHGIQEQTVNIKLYRNYSPERFVISQPLMQIVGQYLDGKMEETRQNIAMAVWQYIKENNLWGADRLTVMNDFLLQQAFGCEQMEISSILTRIQDHLGPIAPISLSYHLRFDSDGTEILIDEKVFDVEVTMDEHLNTVRESSLIQSRKIQEESREELQALEREMMDTVRRLTEHCETRNFMLKFAADPCQFTKKVMESQEKYMNILAMKCMPCPRS